MIFNNGVYLRMTKFDSTLEETKLNNVFKRMHTFTLFGKSWDKSTESKRQWRRQNYYIKNQKTYKHKELHDQRMYEDWKIIEYQKRYWIKREFEKKGEKNQVNDD